ncbi:MAG: hypothetical protein JXR96_02755 [Deltaproteobacteria bacterium]|nr:hypothetical protein [Deltaproteobacteria bacterium]
MNLKTESEIEPVEELDRLLEILFSGYIREFIEYEMSSRIVPHYVILIGDEKIQKMKQFIRRFVIVDMKK